MDSFVLHAPYAPAGDQPKAIKELTDGILKGDRVQTLLGVTGSGKTYTMANVIANVNKPTLVLAHNKILAAQLCSEFKAFFPENAVEYFVSYYDYYQSEAYVPSTDSYIEKDYYPCASYFRDTEEKYDFERVPDLVVINLGTNDQSKGCKDKDFKERVEELVNLVRDSYGENVEILWIYDMMNYGKQDLVLATLDEMGGELMGLYTLKVTRDNNGGTSHPDLKAHGVVAQQLIDFIEENYLLY